MSSQTTTTHKPARQNQQEGINQTAQRQQGSNLHEHEHKRKPACENHAKNVETTAFPGVSKTAPKRCSNIRITRSPITPSSKFSYSPARPKNSSLRHPTFTRQIHASSAAQEDATHSPRPQRTMSAQRGRVRVLTAQCSEHPHPPIVNYRHAIARMRAIMPSDRVPSPRKRPSRCHRPCRHGRRIASTPLRGLGPCRRRGWPHTATRAD